MTIRHYIFSLIVAFFLLNSMLAIFSSGTYFKGTHIFTATSDSMAPYITTNDVFIVKKFPMNSYSIGDVISFYEKVGDGERIITHRIYRLGGNVYITKGDANEAIDEEYVRPRLIIGKVTKIIPHVGLYLSFLKTDKGMMFFVFIPALIIMLNRIFYILLLESAPNVSANKKKKK